MIRVKSSFCINKGGICTKDHVDKAALKEAILVNTVICLLVACEVSIAMAWSSLIATIVAICAAIVSGVIFWYSRGGIALILGISTYSQAVLLIGAICISSVSGLGFNNILMIGVIIELAIQMAASSGYIKGEI